MKTSSSFLLGASAFVGLLAASSNAGAALESCGGVYLSSDAQCEFRRAQECEER
jgi:hypothetical protein